MIVLGIEFVKNKSYDKLDILNDWKRMRKIKKSKTKTKAFVPEFIADSTLDYHELGILTLFEIETIFNNFIEDSYMSKHKYLLIITGKGQVVKPVVNKIIKKNEYILSFKSAGYFNGGNGAIEVTLKD